MLEHKSHPHKPTFGFGRRESALILAAAVLQIGLLTWMTIAASIPRQTGRIVLLPVEPVDPRDLFRGDHVILGYSFNRVNFSGEAARGDSVYVELIPEADGLHYRGATPTLDPPPPGSLYLRGTLDGPSWASFGIETYYVQEGTGHRYEDAVRQGKLWARVAVTADGRGGVQGLVIE